MRIGMGYDVHKLVSGRDLIIGGVTIPFEKGLLGHSDADVLIHAIIDALLGAASLGDIGTHFPDSDQAYRGISSIELLKNVGTLLEQNLYVIENIDASVIAQEPKISPYIQNMRLTISGALKIEPNQINIKATTEEGLGFTGNGEGVSSHAVCLIESLWNHQITAADSAFNRKTSCEGCQGCSSNPQKRFLDSEEIREKQDSRRK